MRNRRFLQFEKPAGAQGPALTVQILATACMPLLKDKFLAAPYYALTGPGETERAVAHLPMVFGSLYCKLERLRDAAPWRSTGWSPVRCLWKST
jgi:hypothetical protein